MGGCPIFSFLIFSYSEKLLTTFCTSNLPLVCSSSVRKGWDNTDNVSAACCLSVSVWKNHWQHRPVRMWLSGKWFLGKVDDGFQSLATYSIQQVYCLLKSEYKVGYDVILLRESRLMRALIIFWFLRQSVEKCNRSSYCWKIHLFLWLKISDYTWIKVWLSATCDGVRWQPVVCNLPAILRSMLPCLQVWKQ